jgi:O-antigen ligase
MRFRDWVTALGGLAAVAVSIFAVGGVLRGAQAVVALLVAVALGAAVVSKRGLARVSPLMALLGIAATLTALQLIPLPASLLDVLSPTANALREDGATLLRVSPPQTLTTDVPGTIGALALLLTLLGIAYVALRMSTAEKGRYRVIAAVALMCGLTALTVGIHRLLGLTSLYGIYEPRYAKPILMGPILNGNSLACLMAAGAMLSIGLAAYRRQPGWLRAMWLVIVTACGGITVMTVSRGATLAFAAGGLMTVCVLIAQRLIGHEVSKRRRARFITSALPIGIVAGCMVILVIWSYSGNVERQLANLSVDELSQTRSKFAAWRAAPALIEESPWLGIGRGAFESAFSRVHPASGVATYSHLENEYLQAVVDWGIVGALGLAIAAIWLAVIAVKRWRDGPLAAGALGALTVVAMQSNVDFGIEFLGLAAPITAVAATLVYVPLREVTHLRKVRAARIAHIVALAVLAVLLLTSVTTPLDEDRHELSVRPTIAKVRAAFERHPLDYYAFAKGAELLDAANNPRAIMLLNHAMALHPTHPGLHRMAARMLYRSDFISQAAIEYAAAMRSTTQPLKLIAEIVAVFPREQAAGALPLDYPYPEMLTRMLNDLGRSDVATLWLSRALEQRPNQSRPCEQLFLIIAHRGDLVAAQTAIKRCPEMLPDFQTRIALAQTLAKHGGHAEVITLLHDVETWESRVDDKINAWLAMCDSHRALDHIDDAKRCLRRLDASADMRADRRSEIISRLEAMQKPLDIQTVSPAKPVDLPGLPPPATGSAAPRK